jgi:hypothetical protein
MAPPFAAEGAAEVQAAYANAASMRTKCIMYETRRSKRQRHSPHRFYVSDPRYNTNTGCNTGTGTGNQNSTSKSNDKDQKEDEDEENHNKDSHNHVTSQKSERNNQKRTSAMAKKSVGRDSSEDRPIDSHTKKKEMMEQHSRQCLKAKPQTAIKRSSRDRNCRHYPDPSPNKATQMASSSSSLSSVSLASEGEGEGSPRNKKDEDEDYVTDSDSDAGDDDDDDEWASTNLTNDDDKEDNGDAAADDDHEEEEDNDETDNVQSKFEVNDADDQLAFDTHWNQMLSQLLEYRTETGTWVIPRKSRSHTRLYKWVAEQRKLYRRGDLQTKTPARLEALTKAGVPIDKTKCWFYKRCPDPDAELKWNRSYEELKNYYATYHTKVIPLVSHPDLHHWNHWQVQTFRYGKMEPHRLEKLREIGCPLEKWFFASNTTAHSDDKDKPAIGDGSAVVADNGATPSQKRMLELLGPNSAREQRFQTAVDQLVQWHDTHGTWFVKQAQNKSLYRYVLKFTSKKNPRVKLWKTPARVAKLRAVGFPIDDYDMSSASEEEMEEEEEEEDHANVAVAQSRKIKAGSEHEDDAVIRRSPRRRMPQRRQFGA